MASAVISSASRSTLLQTCAAIEAAPLPLAWSASHASEQAFTQSKLQARKVQASHEKALLVEEDSEALRSSARDALQKQRHAQLARERARGRAQLRARGASGNSSGTGALVFFKPVELDGKNVFICESCTGEARQLAVAANMHPILGDRICEASFLMLARPERVHATKPA